jgi:hypothetical protein
MSKGVRISVVNRVGERDHRLARLFVEGTLVAHGAVEGGKRNREQNDEPLLLHLG